MPHISRHKHSKQSEEKLTASLYQTLSSINDKNEMLWFLDSLLTETEKVMLAKRLGAAILVEERFKDADISKKLHLTRITVAKMRYFLEARGKKFKSLLNRLKGQKKLEGFEDFLRSIPV